MIGCFIARARLSLLRKQCQRAFSLSLPVSSGELGNRCSLNIVHSPFPPVAPGPYPPLYEFLTENWEPHGGYLSDKIAMIDGSTGLQRTFSDYYKTAGGLAGALRYDMGVDETSTVAVFSPNHVDYVPTMLAIALCGAKATPVNPLFTVGELVVILERSRTSVLIAHESMLETALKAAKECSYVKHVVMITDETNAPVPVGTVNLDDLRSHDKSFHETIHYLHRNTSSQPFCIPYSSGTTGLPKGVCLSHENIVVNLLQLAEIESIPFAPSHKLISPLPFFHIYAFTVSMMYATWQGQTVITTSQRFDLEQFCQLVEKHKPRRAHLVPPIIIGLEKHPVVDKYDLSSLQMIISAAAPLGPDTHHALQARIGCDIKQGWGMSELSPLGTLASDFNIKPGSVGPLVPSTLAKIIDENGKSLGPNKEGELVLKGPQVMMGYLDDPDKTRECLSDTGWLRTGDVAYYDEDGFFYITDRIKELIKVRGYPVAPAELESLLLRHEAVKDAAVIRMPDEDAGELPRAYIVLKENANVTEGEIYDWVKEQVAPYKRLKGGIAFVELIPKSASGKILRRILQDQLAKEMENKNE